MLIIHLFLYHLIKKLIVLYCHEQANYSFLVPWNSAFGRICQVPLEEGLFMQMRRGRQDSFKFDSVCRNQLQLKQHREVLLWSTVSKKMFVMLRGEERKISVAFRFWSGIMKWRVLENLSPSSAAIPLSPREKPHILAKKIFGLDELFWLH